MTGDHQPEAERPPAPTRSEPGRPQLRRWFGWLCRVQAAGFVAGLVVGLVLALLPPLLLGRDSTIEPGELVIMMDQDQSVGQQRRALIEAWGDLQEDISVRIIEVSPTATAARSQLVAHAQNGGGDVDIYSLDVTWVAEFAQQEWLQPIDLAAIDESAFLETPLDAGRYDGQLWALPFNTDAALLYYRRDLLGDDPPVTWEQARAMWEELAATAGAPRAGLAAQYADYEGFTVNLWEALLVQDRQALTGDIWATREDLWADALGLLAADFAPVEQGGFVLPESLAHDESASFEAFRSKQVLFMRNWPLAFRRLTEIDAEFADEDACSCDDDAEAGPGPESSDAQWLRPEDVGVTTLPTAAGGEGQPGASVLGGQSLAIASGSDQPRAAQALIEFLTSARSQERLFVEGGFVPTQKVIFRDLTEEYDYLRHVETAVEQAQPRPVHPRYELISDTVRRVVRPYLEEVSQLPAGEPPDALARQLVEELSDAQVGKRS